MKVLVEYFGDLPCLKDPKHYTDSRVFETGYNFYIFMSYKTADLIISKSTNKKGNYSITIHMGRYLHLIYSITVGKKRIVKIANRSELHRPIVGVATRPIDFNNKQLMHKIKAMYDIGTRYINQLYISEKPLKFAICTKESHVYNFVTNILFDRNLYTVIMQFV